MRYILLLLLFWLAIYLGLPICSSGNNNLPSYADDRVSAAITVPAIPKLLSDIMEITDLGYEFELKEADVPNLEASISHGKKFILYNPDYIRWLNTVTNDKWATLTLLAHEVAHHAKGHTKRRSGSKPRLELQADEYAGYVLQRLGASLQETQEVMKLVANPKASRTHPSRAARMSALQKGWERSAEANGIAAAY